MSTLRRVLYFLRAYLRLAPEFRDALGHYFAMANHRTKWGLGHGVEVRLWIYPESSPYGGGGSMLPLDEHGNRPGDTTTATTTAGSWTSSDVPVTMWRFVG